MSTKTIKITGIRVNRTQNESDFLVFDSDDVFFVSVKNDLLVFHTCHGDFYWVQTLEAIKLLWRDYGFLSLDAVNVVNIRNIKYIDDEKRLVFFADGSSTSVAARKMKLIKQHMKKTTE